MARASGGRHNHGSIIAEFGRYMQDTKIDFVGLRVSVWRWAWTQMRRDWRSGSMRFLLVSVVLAVTALSAVAFFADRIEAGLTRDAAQLIGGDAVVVADQPVPAAFADAAKQRGLRQTSTVVLASMARAPDDKGGDRFACNRVVFRKRVGIQKPNQPAEGIRLALVRRGRQEQEIRCRL